MGRLNEGPEGPCSLRAKGPGLKAYELGRLSQGPEGLCSLV